MIIYALPTGLGISGIGIINQCSTSIAKGSYLKKNQQNQHFFSSMNKLV